MDLVEETVGCHQEDSFSCDLCEFRANSEPGLKAHIVTHFDEEVKTFSCDLCDFSSLEEIGLKDHIISHFPDEYTCDLCPFSAIKEDILSDHIKNCHRKTRKVYSCDSCDFETSVIRQLNRHAKKHLKENSTKCTFCGLKCKTKYTLRRHERVHTGEKPFSCESCGTKFSQNGHRLEHEKLCSSGDGSYTCATCFYSTRSEQNLRSHLYFHSIEDKVVVLQSENRKVFSCSLCDYLSPRFCNFKRHMKTHTEEKSFSCKTCPFRCTSAENLKHHETMHTEEKTSKEQDLFSGSCCFTTTNGWNMKRHQKTHRNAFECGNCGVQFTQGDHLKQHRRRCGTDDFLWFSCSLCEFKCDYYSPAKADHIMSHIEQT